MKLIRIHKDFEYRINKVTHKGVFFQLQQNNLKSKFFFVALKGAYQAENASIAIVAIGKIKKFGFSVSKNIIETALKKAEFAGRFEEITLKKDEILVLDGAHNPAKMHAFVDSLAAIYPKRKKIFIIGFKKDKNIKEMLKSIFDMADVFVVTEFTVTMDWGKNMAAKVTTIKKEIEEMNDNKKEVIYEHNLQKALEKANSLVEKLTIKNEKPLIVVTGSLYLVGEMKGLLHLVK